MIDVTKALEQLTQGNNLLKTILSGDVRDELTDEQIEQIEEAIEETDPKKIKRKANKIINKYT